MNILYLSSLIPECLLQQVLQRDMKNYVVAPHKFHRAVVSGFIKNGQSVRLLSYLPHGFSYSEYINEAGLRYDFLKCSDIKGIKHVQLALRAFLNIRRMVKQGFNPNVIICDILNVSVSVGALLAAKLFKIKTVAIVTDLPNSLSKYEKSIFNRFASLISNQYIYKFDLYVLLTEQMVDVVNPQHKPYIIMEGICDLDHDSAIVSQCSTIRKLFYAGGRPVKDGVEMLISAFKMLPGKNLQLHIYGPLATRQIGPDPEDTRVIYHGVVDNSIVVQAERSATLLINPRPTHEEYTKYSFPSKIMEYMSTGIPVLTTLLPGIPTDYYPYMYTFSECSVESFAKNLEYVLSLPDSVLMNKGKKAKEFVVTNKNNINQTRRIIELINNYENYIR